jgi:hypothetical protein
LWRQNWLRRISDDIKEGMVTGSPIGWNALLALAPFRLERWQGSVWRGHDRDYRGDDAAGSILFSGRYNKGVDTAPLPGCWPALYTSVDRSICYAERLRHTEFDRPRLAAAKWARTVFTRMEVELQAVLNFVDPNPAGLTVDDLCQDSDNPTVDYELPHQVAAAAISMGAEALLVPSATRVDDSIPNVIIFTAELRPGSSIRVVETVEPRHLGQGIHDRLLGPNP